MNSGQVLSQFDGPVTFNGETKFNEDMNIDASMKVTGTFNLTNTTQSNDVGTGALTVDGGVGIDKNLNVGGTLKVTDTTDNTLGNTNTGAVQFDGGVGIDKNLSVGGSVDITTNLTVDGTATFTGNVNSTGVSTFSGGTFGNITIAITNDNTINTTSGNLVLDSNGGTLDVNDNLDVSGTGTFGGNLTVTGSGTFSDDVIAFSSSDMRLKDNVEPIEDAITKVLSLSGNTFEWNDKSNKEGLDIGVIAQEVASLDLPGLYTTRDDGYMAVRYEKLVPLLIEAIKQLNAKVDEHHK